MSENFESINKGNKENRFASNKEWLEVVSSVMSEALNSVGVPRANLVGVIANTPLFSYSVQQFMQKVEDGTVTKEDGFDLVKNCFGLVSSLALATGKKNSSWLTSRKCN